MLVRGTQQWLAMGAEEAAFAEECSTELLLLGGAHTAGVLLDMEKFYDH